MNVTIKTLVVQVANREVPLTKAMVMQLPYMRDAQYQRGEVKCIGDVSLPNEVIYLMQTADGLFQQRSTPHIETTDNGNIQRIILTK